MTPKADPTLGPYDGLDETLIGVLNQSPAVVPSLALSGSGIVSFDGDGLYQELNAPIDSERMHRIISRTAGRRLMHRQPAGP
jgi:hypothetical protein